jgi:hypothetical protein
MIHSGEDTPPVSFVHLPKENPNTEMNELDNDVRKALLNLRKSYQNIEKISYH